MKLASFTYEGKLKYEIVHEEEETIFDVSKWKGWDGPNTLEQLFHASENLKQLKELEKQFLQGMLYGDAEHWRVLL